MIRFGVYPALVLLVKVLVTAGAMESAADRHFQEALEALAAKDYSTALSKFEAALGADPDNPQYGSEYRQAVIEAKQYDRCIGFFEKLVTDHPDAANAYLNYGFSYVDKIPDVGAISQLILANRALSLFSKSIELKPSWIAYLTRGNSYLFWPRVFNRVQLGVADLEEAMKIQKADTKRAYYARTYISLGDGYWKMDEFEKAKAVWRDGVSLFPDNPILKTRLSSEGDELKAIVESGYDPSRRIDTNLKDFWTKR